MDSLLGVYAEYFSSPYAIAILAGAGGGVAALVFVFLRHARDPALRLGVLSPLFTLNLFLWTFLATSVLLCTLASDEVEYAAGLRRLTAVAFIGALGFAVAASTWVWRNAAPRLLRRLGPRFRDLPEDVRGHLDAVARQAGMAPPNAYLLEDVRPLSLAAVGRGAHIVISTGLLNLLDPGETEGVIAHEVMHLRNDDSRFKVFSSTLSLILFFDPITRLIDAAAHREREFLADEMAARTTGRPASLATALLKIDQSASPPSGALGALSIAGTHGRLLRRHPPLEERLARLISLAETLRGKGERFKATGSF